jgi:ABC-2 type transport system permease protein
MNTRMFRMETVLLLRDPKTRWAVLALALLLSVTFAIACRDASLAARESYAVSVKERERWLSQDPKNPHSAAHYGIWAFKSPTSLATLDPGVEPYVGRMVRVEAHRYNDALYRPAQDSAPIARSGISTVAAVMQTIMPLLCLMLAFGAITADRERGTLRLALGNGANGTALIGARTLALAVVAVACAVVPAAVLGALASAILGSEWHAMWPRLLAWTATYAAHAALFVLLGVLISTVARTTRAALAGALFAWVILCVIGPRLANAYVEKAWPTPSWQAARMRAEARIKHYNAGDAHQLREEAFRAKLASPEAGERFDVRGAMLHDREQHDYGVFDAEIGGFRQALRDQDRVFSKLGLLLPTLATQALSGASAGTDLSHHSRFLAAVEAYRRTLSDSMNLDLRAHPGTTGKPYLAGAELWSKLPAFQHQLPTLQAGMDSGPAPILSLTLWLVAAGAGLFVLSRRLKP